MPVLVKAMATGNGHWKSWETIHWNDAIVRVIFLDESKLHIPVSRIDTTERFLVVCTGDAEARPADVKKSFVKSFGKTQPEIFSSFAWPGHVAPRTRVLGLPVNFAALYLTLLAASADENSYSFGQFRDRFISLFDPILAKAPDFQHLPEHWNFVSQWAKKRAIETGDCRVLVLPEPPMYERLIGHSKRLAFPTFKDEVEMQKTISEKHLSKESGFEKVSRELASRQDKFSDNFKTELGEFHKLVTKAKRDDAYASPLWGAFLDISWEIETHNTKSNGSYWIGINNNDPIEPQIFLRSDSTGAKLLEKLVVRREGVSGAEREYDLFRKDESPWIPTTLMDLGAQSLQFKSTKLFRGLMGGSILVLPDKYGILTTQGQYIANGQVGLILDANNSKEIRRCAKHYNITIPNAAPIGSSELGWSVFVFPSLASDALRNLIRNIPDFDDRGIVAAWSPPRPTLKNGSWYGQSLFLNPTSIPSVMMSEAYRGTYALLDGNNAVVQHGEMQANDDAFNIPPDALILSRDFKKVRFELYVPTKEAPEALVVPTIADLPLIAPKNISDRQMWYIDGRSGKLESFETYLKAGSHAGNSSTSRARAQCLYPQRIERLEDGAFEIDRGPHALPVFEWLQESLLLKYQQRMSLQYADLNAFERFGSQASGIPDWKLHRLLINGCWVTRLEKTTSPFGQFVAGDRTLSVMGNGKFFARVAGPLAKSELNRIKTLLAPGCLLNFLNAPIGTLSIGAVEFEVADIQHAHSIASSMGFQILNPTKLGSPIGAVEQFQDSLATPGRPNLKGDRWEIWDPLKRGWAAPDTAEVFSIGSLAKREGGQRIAYMLQEASQSWETNSEVWARLLYLAIKQLPLGQLLSNGHCRINRQIGRLPPAFCRWWLHWGGGVIALDLQGNIALVGEFDASRWVAEMSWLFPAESPKTDRPFEVLERRRQIALRLRQRSLQT